MAANMKSVIYIALALIVVAVIMPLALGLLGASGSQTITLTNGTEVAFSEAVDPAIITLLTILLPIVAVVAIIIYFIPKR